MRKPFSAAVNNVQASAVKPSTGPAGSLPVAHENAVSSPPCRSALRPFPGSLTASA
jgi:hypothetical protein